MDALRVGSAAECIQCGFHLTGEELLALSGPAALVESVGSNLGRLRIGHCARKDCDSFYYRLTFRCVPLLDWKSLLPRIDAIQEELAQEGDNRPNEPALEPRPSPRTLLRLAQSVVLVLGLAVLVLGLWEAYRYIAPLSGSEPVSVRIDAAQDDTPPQ